MDTVGPLPETKNGNRYALVAIDHYSKWCKTLNHDVATAIRFLEEKIIHIFGVPRFIFTDNGGEWMVEFNLMCKEYGNIHRFTAP
jgi:hypothetical protein